MSDEKRCTRCGEVKPLEEFTRRRGASDGHGGLCLACNRLRLAEQRRKFPERERQRKAAWATLNAERLKAKRAAEYRSRKAIENARTAAYYRANPDKWWVYSYRARARAWGFSPVVEDFTRADVVARYGDACAHCGGPFEQIDHYPIPVSQAGPHTLDNVRPSCALCNQQTWRGGEATDTA